MNKKIVLDKNTIKDKVKEIAAMLDKEYEGKNPIVIGIMRGSLYFLSDLTREMKIDLEVDVMSVSSYVGSKTSGTVQIIKDTTIDLTNRDVIIVEDIIDTGTTMKYLETTFKAKNAASVKTVVAFEKETNKDLHISADIIGFKLPDVFLVGYGLDYNNQYRHLKDVYEIEL